MSEVGMPASQAWVIAGTFIVLGTDKFIFTMNPLYRLDVQRSLARRLTAGQRVHRTLYPAIGTVARLHSGADAKAPFAHHPALVGDLWALGVDAAIDAVDLAGHPLAAIGGKKGDHFRDVFGFAEARYQLVADEH